MKNFYERTVSVFLSLMIGIYGFVLPFVNVTNTKAVSEKLLRINYGDIQSVGTQNINGNACACYAWAYVRTIVDGYPHKWWEYDANDGDYGEENTWSMWHGAEYPYCKTSSKHDALYYIYNEIEIGRPLVAHVRSNDPYYTQEHWVAVVGYTNFSGIDSLNEGNFLIIDPADSSTLYSPARMSDKYSLQLEDGEYSLRRLSYGSVPVINNGQPSKPYLTVNPGDSDSETSFNWTECSDTTHYDLRIYDSNGDVAFAIGQCDDAINFGEYTMFTDLTFSKKLASGHYSARVAAVNNDSGKYNFSDFCSFYVEEAVTTIPSKPELTVNAKDQNNSSSFIWNKCKNATDYKLTIYDNNSNEVYLNYENESPSLFTRIDAGYYYAQVTATNSETGESSKSSIIHFEIPYPTPTEYSEEYLLKSKIKPIMSTSQQVISYEDAKSNRLRTISINLSGADLKWVSSQIMVFFDERLTFANDKYDNGGIKKGEAAKYVAMGSYTKDKETQNNFIENNMRGIYIYTIGAGDYGQDGIYCSFDVLLPEDVKPGDVYPIDIVESSKVIHYDSLFLDAGRLNGDAHAYLFKKGIYNQNTPLGNSEVYGKALTDFQYLNDIKQVSALADIDKSFDGYIAIADEAEPVVSETTTSLSSTISVTTTNTTSIKSTTTKAASESTAIASESISAEKITTSVSHTKAIDTLTTQTAVKTTKITDAITIVNSTTKNATTEKSTTSTTLPELTVDTTNISLINGEQYSITANRKDISYKSNNTDVAIVSSKGVITAVGVGSATISVIDPDSNVVQIKVTVAPVTTTVTSTTAKPTTTTTTSTSTTKTTTSTITAKLTTSTTTTTLITSKQTTTLVTTVKPIVLEENNIAIFNGEQYTIPLDRNDITFKSNNPDVAVVSKNGIITAVGTGSATISLIDPDSNVVQIKVTVAPVTTTITSTTSKPTTTTTANPTTTISTSTTAKTTAATLDSTTLPVTTLPVATSTAPENIEYALGDVNTDGKIDANDATLVLVNYSLLSTGEPIQLTESQQKAADVNGDGKIDASDATLILQYYSYLSTGGDMDFKSFIK